MSDRFFAIQDELKPALRAGNLSRCVDAIEAELAGLPQSPFHVALDLHFTNAPSAVAAHFDAFFCDNAPRFSLAAAYAEMNGFSINTDCWFFDVFAYDRYGGHADYEWLCAWQSARFPQMTLTGMEALQGIYASSVFDDPDFKDACYMTDLLVAARFQQLIHRAAPLMTELRFPLLSTAHDMDFIAEVRPD